MLLSDLGIWEALQMDWIDIEPNPDKDDVQPASVDLHLSPWVRHFRTLTPQQPVDPFLEETCVDLTVLQEFSRFTLLPGEFILGSTEELVRLGPRHAARLEGKSSLGRLGLSIHTTAGFIDPGFAGHPTLEITNMLRRSVVLTAGMPICQLAIHVLDQPSVRPYSERGSYIDQGAQPEPSRYWRKYGPKTPT